MTKKTSLIVVLLAVLILSVGSVLLINNTDLLIDWETNKVSLLKQYLKVIGFLSIMGLVYLRMKSVKRTDDFKL